MSFYELLDQAIGLLERHGRVTYRALKLELQLDDEELEAIKDELVYAQQLAMDEDGRVLVYTGDGQTDPVSSAISPARATPPPRGRRPPYHRGDTPEHGESRPELGARDETTWIHGA